MRPRTDGMSRSAFSYYGTNSEAATEVIGRSICMFSFSASDEVVPIEMRIFCASHEPISRSHYCHQSSTVKST